MLSFTFTYREKGILPKLIQWFQKGKYNHVIIGVDGVYFEAIGGRLFGVNGVVMSPDKFSYHRNKYKPAEYKTILVPTEKTTLIYKYLKAQVGKKYDSDEFLSYAFRWVRGGAAQHTCVELALRAYEIATGKTYSQKYTPQEFYELIK